MTDFCLTLFHGTTRDTLEEREHIHVEAPDKDTAIAGLFHHCITQNISVVGCHIAVMVSEPIDELTMRYVEKARLLNHGHTAPMPASTPGGGHHLH